MGEIADNLIDGTFDAETGEYLGEGPGYPRVQRKGRIVPQTQDSSSDESQDLNGVTIYLKKKGYTTKSERRDIMLEFSNMATSCSNKVVASYIQNNWAQFVSLINKK